MGETEITCAAGTIVGEVRDNAKLFDAIPFLEKAHPFDDPVALKQGLLIDATAPLSRLTAGIDSARRAVRRARGRYSFDRHGVLAAPLAAVEILADLSPIVRLQGLRRHTPYFERRILPKSVCQVPHTEGKRRLRPRVFHRA